MSATPQTIAELNNEECKQIINLLLPLDEYIEKKINYIQLKCGLNFKESLEYVVTNNPVLWAKVYLDWEARDYQDVIISEGKKSKKLVLRLGRRLGKCLNSSSKILNCQTGQYISIEELYNKQEKVDIFSFDTTTQKIIPWKTDIITNNGIKPVYKITTVTGREITCTGNHPFWCIDGYKELDDLHIGDYISIAKIPEPINPQPIDEDIIKLLAYLIGDGAITQDIRFTKESPQIINELYDIAKTLQCQLNLIDKRDGITYSITGKKISDTKYEHNFVKDIVVKYGLFGKKSIEKTIPKEIFSLPNSQLALFLNRLYSTDGWVTSHIKEKARIEIGYSTASKEMAVQIQSLLLRFGINSVLCKKKTKASKDSVEYFESWVVGVYSKHDIELFYKKIGIFDRQKQLKQAMTISQTMNSYGQAFPIFINNIIEEEINARGITERQLRNATGYRLDTHYNSVSYDKVKRANDFINSSKIQTYLDSDVIWDKVKSIDYVGEEQTYDFTVPNYHNFVVNDFITHNTDSMCILILWYAYTQINRGPNNKYDIIIATPYETQIDLIFKRLHQLIEMSPVLQSLISRDVHHNICLDINGITSNILGLTAGANNSSGGANSSRGQAADLLILDEADYIGSNQITNILNIRNEAPERIRLICASTPSGKHEEYYRWCVGASRKYFPSKDDIKNNTFSGYQTEQKAIGDGNGWTEIYAPSNVNKELLKINPDTQQTYLEDIRDELSEMRYVQEVMAEFGEEEMGVYQKRFVQAAIDEGQRIKFRYITKWAKEDRMAYLKRTHGQCIRILGVDWDKYQAGTTLVCTEYDLFHQDEEGRIVPVFRVLFRIEIPRSDSTYVNSMNKIIALNEEYDFDWIAVDRGYGEVQLELLHKYGMQNPKSGLADKVIGYQFSEKIEVRDPYTKKKDQKPMKPFMVNNSVNLFEKYKIVLDPTDKVMISQLEEYRVKSISSTGNPIYTDENEHSIDAMNLGLLLFEQKYDSLLRKMMSIKTVFIGQIDNRPTNVKSRDIDDQEEKPFVKIIKTSDKEGIVSITPMQRQTAKPMFKRRMF